MVPAVVLAAWKSYFELLYPKLKIVFFTSLPSYNLQEGSQPSGLKGSRRKGKMRMAAEGALNLWETCQEVCQNQGLCQSWFVIFPLNYNDDELWKRIFKKKIGKEFFFFTLDY